MIRTRDFLVFVATFLFLAGGIGATVVADSWSTAGQLAAVGQSQVDLRAGAVLEGADAASTPVIPRESNIARLQQKIAAGAGDVAAGGPIFTSVDTVSISDNEPAITDQTPAESIMIGHTTDGSPLLSDELWRFAGFAFYEQVGTANDGLPIYGGRADNLPLDSCGGVDEGLGYRYYIQLGKAVGAGCFGT